MRKFVKTSIKLDATMHETVARVARERDCSVSELIRNALAASLDICPTCRREHSSPGRSRHAAA